MAICPLQLLYPPDGVAKLLILPRVVDGHVAINTTVVGSTEKSEQGYGADTNDPCGFPQTKTPLTFRIELLPHSVALGRAVVTFPPTFVLHVAYSSLPTKTALLQEFV